MNKALSNFRFRLCGWSKAICDCCGFRFEPQDSFVRITVGDNIKYFHDDCLSEMDARETLEHFGIEIEEVEI